MGRIRVIWALMCAMVFFSCSSEQEMLDDATIQSAASQELTDKIYGTKIEYYPEFSWDKVNVYAHIYKGGENFTEQEAEFVANTYDIVTLENAHGDKTNIGNDIERHTAAVMIKKYNPKCKVLAYRSINSENTSGSSGAVFSEPEYAYMELYSIYGEAQGKLDHTNDAATQHWVDCVTIALDLGALDGLFVDSYGLYNDEALNESIMGLEGSIARQQGVFSMLDAVNDYYDNEKILIGNSFAYGRLAEFETEVVSTHVAGGMIEAFASLNSVDAENIANNIEVLRYMASIKKICIAKSWPRYEPSNMPESAMSQEEIEAVAREDIVFPLACFLMGAGEYSYFSYSWFWGLYTGASIEYEEYTKSLGEPLGDYVADGWDYYREFKHAKVWANLETRIAKIEWDE